MNGRKARALRKLFNATTRKDGEEHTIIQLGQRKYVDPLDPEGTRVYPVTRHFTSPCNHMYRWTKRAARGVACTSLPKVFRANVARAYQEEYILQVQKDAKPKGILAKVKHHVQTTMLSRKLKREHRQALVAAGKKRVRYV
jgi:hypothetical protein